MVWLLCAAAAAAIERALEAGVRVDTTLRELYPDVARASFKAVP